MRRRRGSNLFPGVGVPEPKRGKVRYYPLVFKNPFYTVGNRGFKFPSFDSAVSFEGSATNLNARDRMLQAQRYRELQNAGFNMSDIVNPLTDSASYDITMPEGTRNVEDRDKQLEAMRKIERQNAGITGNNLNKYLHLIDLMQKRKENDRILNLIKAVTLNDELDQIPTEFQEEARSYALGLQDKALRDQILRQLDKFMEKRDRVINLKQGHVGVEPIAKFSSNYEHATGEERRQIEEEYIKMARERYVKYYTETYGRAPSNDLVKEYIAELSRPFSATTALTAANADGPSSTNLALQPPNRKAGVQPLSFDAIAQTQRTKFGSAPPFFTNVAPEAEHKKAAKEFADVMDEMEELSAAATPNPEEEEEEEEEEGEEGTSTVPQKGTASFEVVPGSGTQTVPEATPTKGDKQQAKVQKEVDEAVDAVEDYNEEGQDQFNDVEDALTQLGANQPAPKKSLNNPNATEGLTVEPVSQHAVNAHNGVTTQIGIEKAGNPSVARPTYQGKTETEKAMMPEPGANPSSINVEPMKTKKPRTSANQRAIQEGRSLYGNIPLPPRH